MHPYVLSLSACYACNPWPFPFSSPLFTFPFPFFPLPAPRFPPRPTSASCSQQHRPPSTYTRRRLRPRPPAAAATYTYRSTPQHPPTPAATRTYSSTPQHPHAAPAYPRRRSSLSQRLQQYPSTRPPCAAVPHLLVPFRSSSCPPFALPPIPAPAGDDPLLSPTLPVLPNTHTSCETPVESPSLPFLSPPRDFEHYGGAMSDETRGRESVVRSTTRLTRAHAYRG